MGDTSPTIEELRTYATSLRNKLENSVPQLSRLERAKVEAELEFAESEIARLEK